MSQVKNKIVLKCSLEIAGFFFSNDDSKDSNSAKRQKKENCEILMARRE